MNDFRPGASMLDSHQDAMPVLVGIGAGAGGLQALEQFFGAEARLVGASFVVVQPSGAELPSLLPEFLQRVTPLPVGKILSGVDLLPDAVYVAPPGCEVRIDHDRLVLDEPPADAPPRHPIDSFFGSLAKQRSFVGVGVLLSGAGSDGTGGLQALRESGGAAFVQSPETARCAGMPESAVRAGVADVVASPDVLPALIADYLTHLHLSLATAPAVRRSRGPSVAGADAPDKLAGILACLETRTGHDFSQYKKSTMRRRVERRMAVHRVFDHQAYEEILGHDVAEVDLLFKDMLGGVTSFFRDPQVWEHLQATALPDLLANRPARTPLRAWVAGCATGEEAYSLAMVLTDALQGVSKGQRPAFKVYATDLDPDAIDFARRACYPTRIAKDLSPDRLARFFVEDVGGYRIRPELRERLVFANHDLAADPPFAQLDLMVCRNLLVCCEPVLQRRLCAGFHHSLAAGGLLLLGSTESIGATARYFLPLPSKFKLFRRLESLRSVHAAPAPSPGSLPASAPTAPPRVTPRLTLVDTAPAAAAASQDHEVQHLRQALRTALEEANDLAQQLRAANEALKAVEHPPRVQVDEPPVANPSTVTHRARTRARATLASKRRRRLA